MIMKQLKSCIHNQVNRFDLGNQITTIGGVYTSPFVEKIS